jgi:hypothetical protein
MTRCTPTKSRKAFNVYLPYPLFQKMEAHCYEANISRNKFINELVESAMNGNPTYAKQARVKGLLSELNAAINAI